MEIPCLGLGCWQLGGHGWGQTSEPEIIKAIHKAIEKGLTLFDTAPIYGLGHSEEMLGKIIAGKRKDVIIATKVGLRWKTDNGFSRHNDCSQANILKEIDASLKRLNTDYIDIYQIHWPDPATPIADTLAVMEKLKQAGKIKEIGCCNFTLDLLKEALQYGHIARLQMPYSLIDRTIEADLLPFCQTQNIAVIAYNTIAQGILTGHFDTARKFGSDDHRSRHQYFQPQELAKNLAIAEKVKAVAKKINRQPVQVALRWILDNQIVTSALFGVTKTQQLEENLGALDFKLSKNDMEYLNDVHK
jgi:aryl-alcohol dehydrogenase-like predicted oxidoreductase